MIYFRSENSTWWSRSGYSLFSDVPVPPCWCSSLSVLLCTGSFVVEVLNWQGKNAPIQNVHSNNAQQQQWGKLNLSQDFWENQSVPSKAITEIILKKQGVFKHPQLPGASPNSYLLLWLLLSNLTTSVHSNTQVLNSLNSQEVFCSGGSNLLHSTCSNGLMRVGVFFLW